MQTQRAVVAGAAPCCLEIGPDNTAEPISKMGWMWRETDSRQRRSPVALEVSVVRSFWGCSRSLDRKLAVPDLIDFLNDQQRCRSAAVAVVSVMVGVVAIDVGSGRLDFLSALSKLKSEENKITSFRAATLTIRNS